MMDRRKNTAGANANLRPEMTFKQAAAEWIKAMTFSPIAGQQSRMGFIGSRTLRDYRTCSRCLAKHFADMRLQNITPADLRRYQEARAAGTYTTVKQRNMAGPGACATTINKELGLLLRMLRFSKAWTYEMMDSYMPLRYEQPDQQRALTLEEQKHFLDVAASKGKWARIYWYAVFCLHTTMSTNEVRGLKVRDINLSQAVVIVRPESAKNKYRIRTIPLDGEALKAATALLELARERGSFHPEHFVFPFRVKRGEYDSMRPLTQWGFNTMWEQVRAAADLPWLRQYDLRHTAITRLAEAGTPIQVIMDMAGHVSAAMSAHYTHISEQAKRMAVTNSSAVTELNTARRGKKRQAIQMVTDTAKGLSVPALIATMKKLGIPAEQILEIVSSGVA